MKNKQRKPREISLNKKKETEPKDQTKKQYTLSELSDLARQGMHADTIEEKAQIAKIIIENIDVISNSEKVIKTVPFRPEWRAAYNRFDELCIQAAEIEKKMHSAQKLFWSTVENNLDFYGPMRYNTDTNEIDLIEKDED